MIINCTFWGNWAKDIADLALPRTRPKLEIFGDNRTSYPEKTGFVPEGGPG
jgi:hypothetical protein